MLTLMCTVSLTCTACTLLIALETPAAASGSIRQRWTIQGIAPRILSNLDKTLVHRTTRRVILMLKKHFMPTLHNPLLAVEILTGELQLLSPLQELVLRFQVSNQDRHSSLLNISRPIRNILGHAIPLVN
ncbi:hypothetical protein V6N13_089550 [Hibiscus sabdariffa]|uniref:Secreted protein n=1 Tax=Hibiscus sabdariffa TaxID=183260 RepID=A0ABR2QJG1_9ROSI